MCILLLESLGMNGDIFVLCYCVFWFIYQQKWKYTVKLKVSNITWTILVAKLTRFPYPYPFQLLWYFFSFMRLRICYQITFLLLMFCYVFFPFFRIYFISLTSSVIKKTQQAVFCVLGIRKQSQVSRAQKIQIGEFCISDNSKNDVVFLYDYIVFGLVYLECLSIIEWNNDG